jgi:hypothetical protein
MSHFEDEEDAEIQRQLLEAKQRIAYLKRQVEREQKLREKSEVLADEEDEPKQHAAPGRRSPPRSRSPSPPTISKSPNQSRPNSQQQPRSPARESNAEPSQPGALDTESEKVEALQSALESSLQDTTAKRVPGALTGSVGKSRSRPSSRAGHAAERSNMDIPPRPSTSSGTPGSTRKTSSALPSVSSAERSTEKSPSQARPHTSHGSPVSSSSGPGGVSDAPQSAKAKKRPKTAATSFSPSERLSPTRKSYTQSHIEKAQRLSLDDLTRLMADPVFIEATKRKGIEDKDLVPRPQSYFRNQSNRAQLLSKEHARIRFEHYENRRMTLLAMVLSEHETVQDEIAKEQAMFKAEDDRLVSGFYSSLEGEKKRLDKIKRNMEKFQRVQANENGNIIEKRQKFNASKNKFQNRLEDILQQEKEREKKMRDRGKAQKERIRQVAQMKEKMTRMRAEEMKRRFAERDKRIYEKVEEKARVIAERRVKDSSKQQLLKNKQELAKKVIEDRKNQLVSRLYEKEDHLEKIKMRFDEQLEHKRIDKALRMQQRIENVARAKKEAEYKNQVMIKKMQMSWERTERFKEIKEAIQVERGARRKNEIINRHKWRDNTVLERSILPGPGEYHNTKTDMAENTRGARWGKYKPKNDIEWIMYRAAQIPGPGQYTPIDPNQTASNGGTWGKYTPKSDVEWLMYYAEQKPGPGQYKPKHASLESKKAVKWGDFEPLGEIDQIMLRAKHIPGPGQYASKIAPLVKPKLKDIKKSFSGAVGMAMTAGKLIKKSHEAKERVRMRNAQSEGAL